MRCANVTNYFTWPAAGFVDTEIGCFMKPEVSNRPFRTAGFESC
jgi:hypothetical protein